MIRHLTLLFPIAAAAALVLAPGVARAVPAADGLYATVETTHGTFVIDLEFEKAPRTVANFVGLATGARTWVDLNTGLASNQPFYDGLEIPRVEPGFVIQMGSPFNTWGGGPGYQIADEFHPDLAHGEAGIVSMANSGSDTGGSQLFITLRDTPWLNQKHAVFGKVVQGLDVVQAIGLLNGGDVTIRKVTITRVGAAAQAFDVHAWALPVVKQTPVVFDTSQAPTTIQLLYPPKNYTVFHYFNSPNLKDWTMESLQHLAGFYAGTYDVTTEVAGQQRQLFRVAQAEYVPIPQSLNGSTLELTLVPQDLILTLTFTEEARLETNFDEPLGTYNLRTMGGSPVSSGRIGSYRWDAADVVSRYLAFVIEGYNVAFAFNPNFHSSGSGSFTGYEPDNDPETTEQNGPYPYYGPFSLTPNVP